MNSWQDVRRFADALPDAWKGWEVLAADPTRDREAVLAAAALVGQLAGTVTFLADWVRNPTPPTERGN